MTNNSNVTATRGVRRLSPVLCALAVALFAVGLASGWYEYLHRSPAREAQVPGTSAWPAHLALAAVACAWYAAARWRRRHQVGPRGGQLLLCAPLGQSAAGRLAATAWPASWRTVAALPPLALVAYGFWRAGKQVTSGLDPNNVVNAWGGPTYLGAMACHYLDAGLIIAACAWLLARILLPARGKGT